MIGKVKMLLRVKQLKEDQAFRALNAKRAQVRQATEALVEARRAIEESAATLPARELAIWNKVIGAIVALTAIDDTKAEVKALQDEHMQLVDMGERAAHVLARLESELKACVEAHRQAVRNRDKYVELRDEFVSAHQAEVDAKEEGEVEELFSSPRRRIA